MKEVIIYTDGACSGNPGPGGWGAILLYNGHVKEISGYEKQTTNQRMELTACIKALEALKCPCRVIIHTDSAYIYNCFQEKWYENWQANNWKTASKKTVKNVDLWKRLLELIRIHDVKFSKVQGHAGDVWNERADRLAVQAAAEAAEL